MKVLFLPEVRTHFRELSEILFQKDYFGFEEYAINYVRELIFDIESSLPRKLSKPAPPYFNRYGKNMRYSIFKKDKATQWYVFFTKHTKDNELIYLVRYISNNHVTAQHL